MKRKRRKGRESKARGIADRHKKGKLGDKEGRKKIRKEREKEMIVLV